MREKDINLLIKTFQKNSLIKKNFSFFLISLIVFSLAIYAINFFKKTKNITIINQIDKENILAVKKIMTNPQISVKYGEDNKIYHVNAKKAFHENNEEIILEEVFAEFDIGTISAGKVKIDSRNERLTFTNNPLLILNP